MEKRKERVDRGIKVRAESIYLISSYQEMLYLILPRLSIFIFFLLFPIFLSPFPYWHKVFIMSSVFVLLSLVFDFLANFVGLVCLGLAFFVGVGGYISAVLNTKLGLSPYLCVPIASVLGSLFCTLLLLPTLSLRGIYFAIVTLMYPLLMVRIIEALNILGGTNGIVGVEGFGNKWGECYFLTIFCLIFLFGLRRLVHEDIGLVIRAVKENDQSVKASGISPFRIRVFSLLVASFIGSFAGAYISHLYMWAGLSLFALDFSILPIVATVIGSGGTLFGPLLGSVIIIPLSEVLREFGPLRIAIYSLILTFVIVFKSEGIFSYISRKYQQFERWVEV